jgi:prevent-host-death family protein
MTLHSQKERHEVGVRELHDRLSHYLRQVAEGGEVIVTVRGNPIAKLAPIGRSEALEALRQAGLITDPTAARRKMQGRKRPTPSRPVAELVAEQRD